jgi:hypothetical protein
LVPQCRRTKGAGRSRRPPTLSSVCWCADRLVTPAPRPQRVNIGCAVTTTTRSAPTATRTAYPSASPWAIRAGTAAGNLFDRRVIHRGRISGQWCGLSIPSQNSGDKKRSCRRESNRHFAHFSSSRFDWNNDLIAKGLSNEAGAQRKNPAPSSRSSPLIAKASRCDRRLVGHSGPPRGCFGKSWPWGGRTPCGCAHDAPTPDGANVHMPSSAPIPGRF